MSTRIAGGMHPIVRRSAAFAIRHIGPHILNYVARRITGEGEGYKRTYRRKRRVGAGTHLIVHRPRLGMGYRKRRTVHRRVPTIHLAGYRRRRVPTIHLAAGYRRRRVVRLPMRAKASIHRRVPTIHLASGYRRRRVVHRPRINIRAGAWQLPHYGGRRIVRHPHICFI